MIFRYDASKEKCPLPLVNLRIILKKMQLDDSCVFTMSDSGSKKNIPNLLKKLGYCYSQRIISQGVIEITLSKKPTCCEIKEDNV